VALCQARISTKPLWGFSSSNPYPTQSRAEQVELRFPILFEDAAIGPLLQECQIIIGQQ
jgi:hypothetical protein